ncbi:hypothetical protein SAMN04490248_11551 [Salinihabitans flavidus]|uniref:Uncharacterized protein n=2 Tax=Salinihabitans flavidus TaxID=569882 RepID=A0A1H8TFY0_9RHOB|nr:hypothetical protein SAMN04490248_11551 [Salinihabitans flavidus]
MMAATHDERRAAKPRLTDIDLYAWIAQAEAGDALIYHCGFLVVDADIAISTLPADQRKVLRGVADAAFRAAEQGLVHLVQERLGTDRFAYIAIARPRPKAAAASLSSLLLEAQAA